MNKSQQAGNSLKNTSHYQQINNDNKGSRNHNKAIQN